MPLDVKLINLEFPHFPAKWQAVVFRNYGKIPAMRIAKALKTSEENIHNAARDLGLGSFSYQEEWDAKGYITAVRNNWYLLSVSQLLTLLDISLPRLEAMLRDEDFLYHKLGFYKPEFNEVVYSPLSKEDALRTQNIRRLTEENIVARKEKYFDFHSGLNKVSLSVNGKTESLRIVHNYCASDPDFLLNGDFSEYSEKYLTALQACGVNGVWFHGLLSKFAALSPDLLSDGLHEKRLTNLKKFIGYLAKFGIKAYIYLNEPRSQCTSRPEIKEYLYKTVKSIAAAAPGLGGFITITMSENETNCYSRVQPKDIKCPLCKKRAPDDVAVEVNNIFYKAMRDAGSSARLIAWNWGWNDLLGWPREYQERAITKLDKGIDVMCVSEEGLDIEKDGVKNRIIDYSISNPGPSERTEKLWAIAKSAGYNTVAKIQASNSWELSAVPFLPVFSLLYKHLSGVFACGVSDMMLGWTLGGYPSPSLRLVKAFTNGKTLDEFYTEEYGGLAKAAKEACGYFSKAFSQFPFCLIFVYNGPQNYGCANLFYDKPTKLNSTMIGYPFDDIDGWRGNYPREVLLSQLKKLSDGWDEGVKILETAKNSNPAFEELKTIAGAAGSHFKSAYFLTEWILTKDKSMLEKEFENTCKLLNYSAADARIGFEASNHYFYNENNLLEKLINLKYLKGEI